MQFEIKMMKLKSKGFYTIILASKVILLSNHITTYRSTVKIAIPQMFLYAIVMFCCRITTAINVICSGM